MRAGYDVTLIAQHDKDEIVDGIKIIALPKAQNRFTRIFGLTWKAFRLALHQRADIYHFHDPELLAITPVLRLFSRGKIIYDVHENYAYAISVKSWISPWLRRVMAGFFTVTEKVLAARCDGVVAASPDIMERFSRHCHTEVVTNYPLMSWVRPAEIPKRLNQHEIVLVYGGGLTETRGILQLIEMMSHLKDKGSIVLRLFGRFNNVESEKKFKSRINNEGSIKYLGWLPTIEDAVQEFTKADIGLFLFHGDPNVAVGPYRSNKLFQYMAAGLPVVVSNFPAWQELVEKIGCGLVADPLDPENIAQQILVLVHNAQLRSEMGAKGQTAVLDCYNWEFEEKKLLEFYATVS